MGKKSENNKEIPTITSLLNRKKLKVRSPEETLDQSQPIDLTALEREFGEDAHAHSPAPASGEEEDHPPIEGIDVWDTRGIARAVKHNKAARKTEEFKNMFGRSKEDTTTRSHRMSREHSASLRLKRSPPPPPAQPAKRPPGPVSEIEVKRYSNSKPDIQRHQRPAPPAPAPAPMKAPAPPVPMKTPSAPAAPTGPSVRVSVGGHAPSTVQPSSRSQRPVARPPTTWTMEMLKGGPDPLGKGLSILLEKGAQSALFLAITPPPPGAKIPHFSAAAAARPTPDKLRLWTGLRWDPAVVPQVWNSILKSGYIEFHPPGQVTNIGSRRNTIRAAFGLGSEEILLLIRVGPVAACRGILAIYSDRSLLMELGPILTLFNTPLPLQKAG